MPETGVGAQAALALAAHAGCVYPTDVEPSDRWYEPGTDVVDLAMSESGTMRVPDVPLGAPTTTGWSLVCDIS
jgi:L-alanine-DL-glutamate epimerase-like enolase superfamily enzyme